MRKKRHKSFQELINENKNSLLNDAEALNKIYDRLEERLERKAKAE
ncbi:MULTISPECIES: FbpB family small basic protein [unclassified Bacillus (in: firmicutes)]|nr:MULTISPECIES: FbpB family small basic protein [unclassified Bacillus (in: firmicutes)]PEJ57221.1 FbpB family small basic protein [Bacillus sp. AFS002410]PEL12638.1 FbpB family small basic protein [Bacillus sp. AFS017336]